MNALQRFGLRVLARGWRRFLFAEAVFSNRPGIVPLFRSREARDAFRRAHAQRLNHARCELNAALTATGFDGDAAAAAVEDLLPPPTGGA